MPTPQHEDLLHSRIGLDALRPDSEGLRGAVVEAHELLEALAMAGDNPFFDVRVREHDRLLR